MVCFILNPWAYIRYQLGAHKTKSSANKKSNITFTRCPELFTRITKSRVNIYFILLIRPFRWDRHEGKQRWEDCFRTIKFSFCKILKFSLTYFHSAYIGTSWCAIRLIEVDWVIESQHNPIESRPHLHDTHDAAMGSPDNYLYERRTCRIPIPPNWFPRTSQTPTCDLRLANNIKAIRRKNTMRTLRWGSPKATNTGIKLTEWHAPPNPYNSSWLEPMAVNLRFMLTEMLPQREIKSSGG